MFDIASTHAVQLTDRPSIAHPNAVFSFFFVLRKTFLCLLPSIDYFFFETILLHLFFQLIEIASVKCPFSCESNHGHRGERPQFYVVYFVFRLIFLFCFSVLFSVFGWNFPFIFHRFFSIKNTNSTSFSLISYSDTIFTSISINSEVILECKIWIEQFHSDIFGRASLLLSKWFIKRALD